MQIRMIPLDQIDYRWQDSPPDLAISRAHETFLSHADKNLAEGYRLGVAAGGGARGAAFIVLFYDIERQGVMEPLRLGPGPKPGSRLRIILGNRRLAIARALGLGELKCEVYGSIAVQELPR